MEDTPIRKLETRYTIIHYQSYEDLKKFDKKIKYVPVRWGLESLTFKFRNSTLKKRIISKVDALYGRVQDILGIHKGMNRTKIVICPNRDQLHAAYTKVCEEYSRAYGKSLLSRAWYIYELNTIYINVDDLHEGILAHEMAHSVIDQYLFIRPPKPTAEILARYVDKHLFY